VTSPVVQGRHLRVLLGVHQFFPGHGTGTEVLTLELARGLRERGHEVRIVSGAPDPAKRVDHSPWWTADEYDGFPVRRLHFGIARGGDIVTPDFLAPERVRLLRGVAAEERPDLVHFLHLKPFSAEAIPALAGDGFPVLFTPTDYWTVCPTTMLVRRDGRNCDGPSDPALCLECLRPVPRVLARVLVLAGRTPLRHLGGRMAAAGALGRRAGEMFRRVNAASAILPATQFLRDVLVRQGVDPEKIRIMGYGVRLGFLPSHVPIPDRFDEDFPLRVGFIGTLSKLKGPHVPLESVSLLPDPRKVQLEIYGKTDESDPYYRSLREGASKAGASVRFRGTFQHERIGEILRGLHLLVVPSLWYESTPLVLCSALAAGTPAIVSRLGGMTEVIDEGRNGYSFPAGDEEALGSLLRRILDRPDELRMVREKFPVRDRPVERYVDDVVREYERALREGKA
jgi:glycosyltransferase involved in cell wall biosynthesis